MILILAFRLITFFFFHKEGSSTAQFEGLVSSQPQIKFNKIVFTLGKYYVTANYLELSPGDKVTVTGKIEKNRITAEKVLLNKEASLEGTLIKLRENLISRLDRHLPTKESGLLAGILLGSKNALSREIKDKLIATGTMHIVVVSGYNIVLIASFFLAFAKYFGRKKTTLLALFATVVYSLLVGMEPPTLRALIMGAISLLAVLTGRISSAIYSLLVACYLMLILDPGNFTDISFQLTVSATLGIIVFTKPLLGFLKTLPSFFKETLASTLAAQILVTPLIFYYFGNVSLMSPLVNTLVLWTIPLATLLGFILLLVSFVSSFGASLFSTFVYIPLKIFFITVETFSNLQFFVLKFTDTSLVVVAGYYLLVVAVVLNFRKKFFSRKN